MNRFISGLRILPRWLIIIFDMIIISVSLVLAYFLRFNFDIYLVINSNLYYGLLLFNIFGFLSILISRSYSGIVRYTTLKDAVRIFATVLMSSLGVFACSYFNMKFYDLRPVPLSVIIITAFSATSILFLYRILVKHVFTLYTRKVINRKNIAIFGAGVSGSITKQVIENDTASSVRVVGFFEDDSNKVGKDIGGTTIYDARADLEKVLVDNKVDDLIISIQNLDINRKNEIVDTCLKINVNVRTVPNANRWIRGELSMNQIRQIRIDDLLGREVISLNNELINQEITSKVVLVTGAAGSIGSEIVRQVLGFAPELVLLVDQSETAIYELELELSQNFENAKFLSFVSDITDYTRMDYIFGCFSPNIVYHAAAYKHVPLMEKNICESINTNVHGTMNIANLSAKHKVGKFVMISTDKAVNPTNIMGCSKRIAEMFIQYLSNHINNGSTIFVITRFGNVLGSNGSVIPYFKKQIEEGGPITVTHPEITRYFMTIQEACSLVLEASTMGKGGEIYLFDMGESIKIVDLAKKMIKLSGLEIDRDIEIVFTGLRDGEKLYEELLADKENTLPTYHSKILVARNTAVVTQEIIEKINKLISYAEDNKEFDSFQLMKSIVPEFNTKNSRIWKLSGN